MGSPPSYGLYISQVIHFVRVFSHVSDFVNRYKYLTDTLQFQTIRQSATFRMPSNNLVNIPKKAKKYAGEYENCLTLFQCLFWRPYCPQS